jgi:hypothetical protein
MVGLHGYWSFPEDFKKRTFEGIISFPAVQGLRKKGIGRGMELLRSLKGITIKLNQKEVESVETRAVMGEESID